MRFIFFTDTHIKGATPKNRTDDFYQTLKNKFNEIKAICDELNIDYVLHGGDWFDRPDVSPSIVREFAAIVQGYGRPVYTVAGNHDIFGHNPDTIGRTMLGLLEGVGVLRLIGCNDEIVLERQGVRVQLSGKPYRYDIDDEERYRDYYIIKKRKDVDYAVNIVHGMLLNSPFIEGIRYTLIENIRETGADITLAGHYHSGFGIIKKNYKYFINPGSLVRVTNTLSEINRKPKVVIIELAGEVRLWERELKCAAPGEEVLDRQQLENSRDRSFKLYQFYQKIAQTGKYDRIDLGKIIEEIAADSEISKAIKEETVKRIALAREELSKDNEE